MNNVGWYSVSDKAILQKVDGRSNSVCLFRHLFVKTGCEINILPEEIRLEKLSLSGVT